ncbi:sodium:solute symporter family protein [Bacillus aerolatus]|uniref:Sodium:solute symporter family protein n=1 Tax=Bacillus aerolatus TaxID=2653354 RepID=A0A6I1FAI6_9BACI|nr:sodium:solute symporter family protein [Bacillus aerolatus]KAB7704060.1 sodium:solute symporter family protein [Bacillus aerolatus]
MFDPNIKSIILIAVFLYSLAILAHSFYFFKGVKTSDDYNVAGRSIPTFPMILSIVGTATGGASLLGFMGDAYSGGLGMLWLVFPVYIVSAIWIVFFLKPIRSLGTKYKLVTLPDYIALRYGEKARMPALLCILVAYASITGLQFIAIATFLNLMFGLNTTAGIIIGCLFLTLKTYIGGLKAVIWADSIQGTIQTLGIIILFVTVYSLSGGWNTVKENAMAINQPQLVDVFGISTVSILVFIFTLGAYQFVRQDNWQRVWAAKTDKVAVNSNWLALIIGLVTGVFIVLTGVFSSLGLNIQTEQPALIFYQVVSQTMPVPMIVIMVIALVATIVSCADSFFMAGASSIANDIIKPYFKVTNDQKMLQYSRLSVIILSVIALVMSLAIPQLVPLWVAGTAMLTSGLLVPFIAGMLFKRVSETAGTWSIWAGLLTTVIWQIAGQPFGVHQVFPGLLISTLTIIVATLVTQPQNTKLIEDMSYGNNLGSSDELYEQSILKDKTSIKNV